MGAGDGLPASGRESPTTWHSSRRLEVLCVAGDPMIPTRARGNRPSPQLCFSDSLGRSLAFGFLKSRTHFLSKSPTSSCQGADLPLCCPPTTTVMSSHPEKQKAFLRVGKPRRVRSLHFGLGTEGRIHKSWPEATPLPALVAPHGAVQLLGTKRGVFSSPTFC